MSVKTPRRKEVVHDEAPAEVDDHAFIPRDEWWSLCQICGLAQPAHLTTTVDSEEEVKKTPFAYYADDNPEIFDS